MRDSDEVYAFRAKTVHDEKWEAAQEEAATVFEVRSTCLRSFGNLFNRGIELTAKARCRHLVAFAVPSLGGLGFIGCERVDFNRELGHQRAASRRRTSAQGIVFTALPPGSGGRSPD